MESVALFTTAQRRELFLETAARKRMTPSIVEKDFWVCWTLGRLFANSTLSRLLMFKGGTSLSKVFNLIQRFSEDIDLVLDWRVVVGQENPMGQRSASKQAILNQAMNDNAMNYICAELLAKISGAVAPICHCEIASDDLFVVNIQYPAAFSDSYLRPNIRLDIRPLASWIPSHDYSIRSYASEAFPEFFLNPSCTVKSICAERTFWEKATILHHEAHRPEGSAQQLRYSRHYYDLAMMALSPVKNAALKDLELLNDVVEFKRRFYSRGWARYENAIPGSFRLVPRGHVLAAVETDYAQMRNMIFGRYPNLDEILKTLHSLETEINQLRTTE